MANLLLVAQLFLSCVFFVAAAAKLADSPGSRQMIADFGVPSFLVGSFATALPIAEFAVGLALLFARTAWIAAIAAALLLLMFAAAVIGNLARGRTPACNCFGQIQRAPIGPLTVARIAALGLLAGFTVWIGSTTLSPGVLVRIYDLAAPHALIVAGGIALLLLGGEAVLLVQLLQQQGRLLLRLEAIESKFVAAPADSAMPSAVAQLAGLPIGSDAPDFSLPAIDGDRFGLGSLIARGKPIFLVFSNPNCGPCRALLPEIGGWQSNHAAQLTIVIIGEGSEVDNRAEVAVIGGSIPVWLLQHAREVAEAYGAFGTPTAVLVRTDGTIGSGLAQGADAIRAIFDQALGELQSVATSGPPQGTDRPLLGPFVRPQYPAVLSKGQSAPPLRFQGLDGRTVATADFRGRNLLLLFWNPACGFCKEMLGALKSWEAGRTHASPSLLVISTGTAAENRALNLRSHVVLDIDRRAAEVFGANGTPMGVLLDARGKLASNMAVGAAAVLELAARTSSPGADAAKNDEGRLAADLVLS
jgi:thiol-disulfide isomerase/thioredoxin